MKTLRIVPEELWLAAGARLAGIRASLEQVTGHTAGGTRAPRRSGNDSAYLLSGFARCAVCGGGLGVTSSQRKGRRLFTYACTAYHKRGTTVCGNGLALPIERIDDDVLQALAGDVLRPAVVMAVIDGVLEEMNPQAQAGELARLRAEALTVDREMERLTEAIAAGSQLGPLLDALKVRQARRDVLAAAVAARDAVDVRRFDRKTIEATVKEKVAGWRTLLSKSIEDGRQVLREVLVGPLRFTPEGRTYRFEGEAAIGQIVAGMVGLPTVVASPTGFEPVFWP